MSPRRSLLLFTAAGRPTVQLACALASVHDVTEADAPDALWSALDSRAFDLFLADAHAGLPLLEALETRAPSTPRILIFRREDVAATMEALGHGHTFIALPAVDDADVLLRQINSIAHPRQSVRHPAPGLVFRWRDVEHPLLDLSSQGCSLLLTNPVLEPFLPGARLEGFHLGRGVSTVVTGSARVTHLHLHIGTTEGQTLPRYRVGLEFLAPDGGRGSDESRTLTEPLACAALIREALLLGRLALHPVEEPSRRISLLEPHVKLHEKTFGGIVSDGIELDVGQVVRGSFESGGEHGVFHSAVIQSHGEGLELPFPRMLRLRSRRSPNRMRLSANTPIQLELTDVLGRVVSHPVSDLSVRGICIETRADWVLPIGFAVRDASLRLPSGSLRIDATVAHLTSVPTTAEDSQPPNLRCGLAFEPLGASERGRIADAVLETELPGVKDASGLAFPMLWDFLKTSGFIYPEKEEKLRPVLPELTSTMTTLLSRPTGLLKTLVFQQGDALGGHLSALRLHRQTWLIQHLATANESKLMAAQFLNRAIAEYAESQPDITFIQVYFRPQNRWPARVFGRFARQNFDPDACELRTFKYWAGPTEAPALPSSTDLSVGPATPEDLAVLEASFVARRQTLALRAEDTTREALILDGVSREYEAWGLFRRREVLVAKRGGRVRGFARLELSSPGLNFSELTNAFSLRMLEIDPEAAHRLTLGAMERYRALGRTSCVALSEVNESAEHLELAGFQQTKEYSRWTLHRDLFRRFSEFVTRMHDRSLRRRSRTEAVLP